MSTIRTIINEHIEWRGQILKLAKSDLSKTYSGAALGWSWALIKPTMTIAVFWFAFTFGLRFSGSVEGFPFILWMIPGFPLETVLRCFSAPKGTVFPWKRSRGAI